MPQVTYLDVFERDGNFRQDWGTVSSEELLSEHTEPRQPGLGSANSRRFRVLSRIQEAQTTSNELASVQRTFYRAAVSLLADPRQMQRYEHRSVTLTFNTARCTFAILHGRDFRENLEVWLRNSQRQDEALIELPDLDQDRLRAVVSDLQAYSQQVAAWTRVPFRRGEVQSTAPEMPATGTSPADLAAARRLDLAQGWLTASAASEQMGSNASNASVMANQRRRDGDLLGVWVPSERAYRYPTWQFDAEGQPVPQMSEILALLRGPGRMASSDRRTSGWHEVEWFMSPHALLEGSRPYEVLKDEPQRILEIATEQFVEDDDAGGF